MSIKGLHTLIKSAAILLWLGFAVAIVVLILNHSFLEYDANHCSQSFSKLVGVGIDYCSDIIAL